MTRSTCHGHGGPTDDKSTRSKTAYGPEVLRPDGTVVETTAIGESSCRTRYRSGAEITGSASGIVRTHPGGSREVLLARRGIGFACLAPDDSTIVHNIEIGSGAATASRPIAGLLGPRGGAWFEIEGSFAGWR